MKSKTLERFSDKVLQIVRANGIGVFSLSAADNRLYPQAMKNGSLPVELDSVASIDMEDESTLAALVWEAIQKHVHRTSDQELELSGHRLPAPVLIVPILWTREPIEEGEETVRRAVGVMMLWNKRGNDHFDADDHNLAGTLSAQAAALLVEEQLAEFEEIQAAFSTVPIGLMLLSQDGHIIVANQAARQILNQTALSRRHVGEIDYQDQIATLVSDVQKVGSAQATFISPSGVNYIANAQASHDDQIILAFSSSPINQDAEELVGQVAHELRTPLTVIQGNLQTLELLLEDGLQEEDTELVREFLYTSVIQSSRMYRMIDETLNLSRIHVGKELELDIEDFDLIEAIKQVFLELEDRLQRYELVADMPDTFNIQGDRGKVISIIDNYIKNAYKYANPGTTITVRVKPEDGTVALSVQDEGIGIPPDAIERIGREPGFRTDVSKSQAGGIGLGMVYTRRVIEAHGGQMEIESELGKGSTFTAILPKEQ
jgi:signal transduction histidine kinase